MNYNNQFNNQPGYNPSNNGFNDGAYNGGYNNGGYNGGGYNNGGYNNGGFDNGYNNGGFNNGGYNNGGFNNGYNNGGFNNGGFNNGYNNFGGQLSMKWYKFCAYFGIWATALCSLVSAVMHFTGNYLISLMQVLLYEEYGFIPPMSGYETEYFIEGIYSELGALKVVDILGGILLLAGAGIAVFAGINLLKYRRNAPQLFLLSVAACGIVSSILLLAQFFIMGSPSGFSELPTSFVLTTVVPAVFGIIGLVVFLILNKSYFDKRSHMFNR